MITIHIIRLCGNQAEQGGWGGLKYITPGGVAYITEVFSGFAPRDLLYKWNSLWQIILEQSRRTAQSHLLTC